ncbi:hypothetical protein FPSE_03989 [Fusarium pseudograminearum CS3096]|uniref:Putative gamma-glutamylcyclotransferase n=1 Tax=Fusarium pseudograminearum (strain CS3096) TaxID=1028729 RepID=K3VMD1_FUSPC|nr:hypothetical protein FPSE_03989 [Fusarium pseudograminearum CS3096]EKJ75809.1 hypothetical protein FPSE_03989 [Fusarium pseudograminearum CS3096]
MTDANTNDIQIETRVWVRSNRIIGSVAAAFGGAPSNVVMRTLVSQVIGIAIRHQLSGCLLGRPRDRSGPMFLWKFLQVPDALETAAALEEKVYENPTLALSNLPNDAALQALGRKDLTCGNRQTHQQTSLDRYGSDLNRGRGLFLSKVHGYARYSIHHCDYPAVIKKDGHEVDGKKLDDFEGEAYTPTAALATLDDGTTIEADIYLWDGDTESLYTEPGWDLDTFVKERLEDWLDLFEGLRTVRLVFTSTAWYEQQTSAAITSNNVQETYCQSKQVKRE